MNSFYIRPNLYAQPQTSQIYENLIEQKKGKFMTKIALYNNAVCIILFE